MTAQFKCDGPDCPNVMGKRDRRIACTMVEPPWQHDPLNPEEQPPELFEVIDLTIDGGLHFCSPSCMAAHGYAEHLKNLPDG